ncbi:MAG: cobyric acid synthase [Actinomycetota bacterium]|nr:cobyric acid synthase [Actinomycetota bacterium]
MSGALLVVGTASDAGKSVVTAGICRWLAREGIKVAPFKAQNMSLNSMVTADGAEIGRAQVMQAAAARVEPEAAMNPVLLKPGDDRHSQVVVLGKPVAEVDAISYRELKPQLLRVILDSYADLRARFDVVICEGAGSPAEINLRDSDVANMGLARALGLPTIVVGDIDRGGVFASMFGTLAVLSPQDQALICGFVVNKFRGDQRLLAPGSDMLTSMTGRPMLGVLPWQPGLWLDVEDSLDLDSRPRVTSACLGEQTLRIAVIRLPRLSNVTDIDALAAEPGVDVRLVSSPRELVDADLVVLPGTRATVADLAWLRANGLAEAIVQRARRGGATIGICGGYQMLARSITDHIESRAGRVDGLGLLPSDVSFAAEKTLGRPKGSAFGEQVIGYEIHQGQVCVDSGDAFLDGCRDGAVWGTTWHGIFENDGFRRAFLREVAAHAQREFVVAADTSFAALREARLDALGDLVANHVDTGALRRLIETGPPRDLRTVRATLG